MNLHEIVGVLSAFFAGILAGEEFIVRYGVRGPIAALDDRAHIQIRQGLIRTMRVLVPSIYVLALASASAVTVLDGTGSHSGFVFRVSGVASLLVWIAVTLGGTVPINAAALDWDADHPPVSWRAQVERWERLNTVRTWTATVAFALLATALVVRVPR